MPMTDQQTLRRRLRQARQSISATDAASAQVSVLRRVSDLPCFRRAKRIAGYFGRNGELDPTPLLADLARQAKTAYVPVLHPFKPGRLWFCRWAEGDPLVTNRYSIPEPIPSTRRLLAARQLDLVIVPLLGFDRSCQRIGMGGGYYDRSFAFRQRLMYMHRPRLIGLAYEQQRVDGLQTESWDVPLDLVVTPDAVYRRTRHPQD